MVSFQLLALEEQFQTTSETFAEHLMMLSCAHIYDQSSEENSHLQVATPVVSPCLLASPNKISNGLTNQPLKSEY